uniref:Structural maintenance of chromosomes 4 n=1 Tax=Oncorhynchus mykiss TaxID=8022 RepID=A0A8C7UG12_ONCMY
VFFLIFLLIKLFALAPAPGEGAEAVDNRGLEEILGSIPPPPPPAMTNEPGAPCLTITHIFNQNVKSCAGEQILGPFHKVRKSILTPHYGSFVTLGIVVLWLKKSDPKKSVLIHSSDQHKDVQSCTVEVHFQKITDKEGDDYEVIPNSKFYVSRTASKDNSSSYHINGKKATFKDVGTLLRSHGIDLDHNRFLILQGEVEQIAMMKPKGQTEHDEGMMEYLEDIIASCRLKQPSHTLRCRVELLNGERRVRMVEKTALEGVKNTAVEFLTLEDDIFKQKSQLCQYYVHDFQKRVANKEEEKQRIQDDTKELREEQQHRKLTKYKEFQQEKFTQLDLQDVEVVPPLESLLFSPPFLLCQLEEVRNVPATSEKIISEASARREVLEKEKLKEVMESLKEEPSGLQQEKEVVSLNKTRSRQDVAQSDLSRHNTAVTQLNTAKQSLQIASDTLRDRRAAIKELQVKIPQCEQELQKDKAELEQLLQADGQTRELVRDMRQKVEEAKSSLSSNRSRGKVPDALMQQKRSGKIPDILGRLDIDLAQFQLCYSIPQSHSTSLSLLWVCCIDNWYKALTSNVTSNTLTSTLFLSQMKVRENKMGPISTPENIPCLFDMVRVQDESMKPAFYFALRYTLVAKDLEQATRLAFQKDKLWRVVTMQGQIIEMAGGGRVMRGRMGSSIGTEVTQQELDCMESKLIEKVVQLQDCQKWKLQLEEKVQRLLQQLRDMKNTNNMQSLAEQEAHLKPQIKELDDNVLAANPNKNKQKQLEKTLKDFQKASSKAGKVERLHTLIVDINSHKLKAQQDKLDKVNKELDDLSHHQGPGFWFVSRLEETEKSLGELTDHLKRLEEEAGEIMKACREAEAALPVVQKRHQGVVRKIKALQEHALQEESLSSRPPQASKLSVHAIEDDLVAIKGPDVITNQISQMKPNLGAIAEYKNKVHTQLSLGLIKHLDTLDNFKRGCEDLHKQWLNEFMAGFFSLLVMLENYQMLTLGGDAELELVDSLDPFSEGIMFRSADTLAQPEKTLSSLALVFALHHFKPTPLYFMDEINAALDFKNVSIVACYIYEQTKNAQFSRLFISLRNNMFEIADRLIGIYKTHNTTKS